MKSTPERMEHGGAEKAAVVDRMSERAIGWIDESPSRGSGGNSNSNSNSVDESD